LILGVSFMTGCSRRREIGERSLRR
jgi:hypothetical protein